MDLGFESMNVIYNLDDNEATVMAVHDSSFQMNTLKLSPSFLKKMPIDYEKRENKKELKSSKTVENNIIQDKWCKKKIDNDFLEVSVKIS